jgi:hypothetical protein
MHELEALERRGWDALSGPGGEEFYEEHMAADGLMVFPGVVMDKQAALGAIRGAEPWSSYEIEDVRVVQAGADVGVVVYRARARRRDQPQYAAVMSSLYSRRDGVWRLVLHQQTP